MPEPLPEYPPITVVICTRDRPEDIALCLPLVLACDYPEFEVLLIDQSRDEATEIQARALAEKFAALRYVRADCVGKSAALNLGLRLAAHPLLAFTDDDCEVPPDWLAKYAHAFAEDPRVDILFGPVAPAPALAGRQDVAVPSWIFHEERYLRDGEVCGMGANMALRLRDGKPFLQTCQYDTFLGPGAPFPAAEEGDFVYRLRRAGAVAALKPEITVYHRAYRTPERWKTVMYGYGVGDGAFYAKHVRCGDLRAARTLLAKLGYAALRASVRTLRRRPSEAEYLRGLCWGIRAGRRLAVDSARRVYVEQGASA